MHKPSFFRKIAALIYDILTNIALLMLMAFIAIVLNNGDSFGANNPIFLSYLIICTGSLQCWFWCKSGQSIGMLAWKIKITKKNGKLLDPITAIKRYLISIPCVWFFGIGYFWSIFDKDRMLLQDRISSTEIILN